VIAEAGQTCTQRRQRMQLSGDCAVARPALFQSNTDFGQTSMQWPQATQLDESTTTRGVAVPLDDEPVDAFDEPAEVPDDPLVPLDGEPAVPLASF
jgi:hypothetical protein